MTYAPSQNHGIFKVFQQGQGGENLGNLLDIDQAHRVRSSAPLPPSCYKWFDQEQCDANFKKYELDLWEWSNELIREGDNVAREELDKAVRIFNCRARGENFCF